MARFTDRLDRQPGTLPDIWVEGDSLLFALRVPVTSRVTCEETLVIRCDSAGNLWTRIGGGRNHPTKS